MVDIAIKGGKIVFPDGIVSANLLIDRGKVIKLTKILHPADKIVNVKNKLILPGLIDSHVHLRDPGLTYKEDFYTGTMAAAAGGVTSVFDMSNNNPLTITLKAFQQKRKIAEKKAVVDFGLAAGVSSNTLEEIPKLAKAGAIFFGEMYLADLTNLLVDESTLAKALKIIKKVNSIAAIHAESENICSSLFEIYKKETKDPLLHLKTRPNVAEADAVFKTLLLLSKEKINTRVHFCHISARESIEILEQMKNKLPFTVEVTPHHLLLTADDLKCMKGFAKTNPPLRSKQDQEALWKGIRSGLITTIASDHAPHSKEEKESENIWKVPSGIPGLETMLMLMLTMVNKKRLKLMKLVQLTSENPARIFGLYPRKGSLKKGSDADLVIVDLKKKTKIKSDKFYSKSKLTPFEGWIVQGVPVMTFVRGQLVMEDGTVYGQRGYGKFLLPQS